MSEYPIIIQSIGDTTLKIIESEEDLPHYTYFVLATQEDKELFKRLKEGVESPIAWEACYD